MSNEEQRQQAERRPVVYTSENMSDIIEKLWPVSPKWKYVGIHLGIQKTVLDQIKADHGNNTRDCLLEVISERLKQGPLPLSSVLVVLRKKSVGEGPLADHLDNSDLTEDDDTFKPEPEPDLHITKTNVLHHLAPYISDRIFPYTHFKNKYPTHVPFGLFIILQIFGMLDDKVFRPQSYTSEEYVNRVVFFLMRTFLMIVTPSICYAQLCILAKLEKKFVNQERSEFDNRQLQIQAETERNVTKIFQDRKVSLNPIRFFREFGPLFRLRGIEISDFQVLIHAIVFPVFLYYLGVFHSTHTYQPIGAAVSWRSRLQVRGVQILEIWDCIAVVIILMLSGVLKDVYCLENHIGTVFADNDSPTEPTPHKLRIFQAVRCRWFIIDKYLHGLALLYAFLTAVLVFHGEPFTPKYFQANPIEQNIWNILTVIITLMQFGGSSASPDFKAFSIVGYFAIPLITFGSLYILSYDVEILKEGFHFQCAPGSMLLLLYTTHIVSILNWVLCLFHSYWRQNELKTRSYHACLLSIALLSVCLCSVTICEFRLNNFNNNCKCHCNAH